MNLRHSLVNPKHSPMSLKHSLTNLRHSSTKLNGSMANFKDAPGVVRTRSAVQASNGVSLRQE
jgi:hypothetical protein